MDEVANNLSLNVRAEYGRLPSNSTYELPLGTRYDPDLHSPTALDFTSAHDSTENSNTGSKTGSRTVSIKSPKNIDAHEIMENIDESENRPIDISRVQSTADQPEIIPPTPASALTGSRPTSGVFFPPNGSEPVVPPTPATIRPSRPDSGLFDAPIAGLSEATDQESRERVVAEIGDQLSDLFNDHKVY